MNLFVLCAVAMATMATHEIPVDAAGSPEELTQVWCVNDSVGIGMQPYIAARLEGVAKVTRIPDNGRGTRYSLSHVEAWIDGLGSEAPDLVICNWALGDVGRGSAEGWVWITPEEYEANLRVLLGRMLEISNGHVLYVLGTAVDDAVQPDSNGIYRQDADLVIRNQVAVQVCAELEIPAVNIYELSKALQDQGLQTDGVHWDALGSQRLGEMVGCAASEQLAMADVGLWGMLLVAGVALRRKRRG